MGQTTSKEATNTDNENKKRFKRKRRDKTIYSAFFAADRLLIYLHTFLSSTLYLYSHNFDHSAVARPVQERALVRLEVDDEVFDR